MVVALREVTDVVPRHTDDDRDDREYNRDDLNTAIELALLNERFKKMDEAGLKWQGEITGQLRRLVESITTDAGNLSSHIVHSDSDRAELHRNQAEIRNDLVDLKLRQDKLEQKIEGTITTTWIKVVVSDGWKTIASAIIAGWALYQLGHSMGWWH